MPAFWARRRTRSHVRVKLSGWIGPPHSLARFKTRFDVVYASGRHEGDGELTEISYSGARIEGASLRPTEGTQVTLYIFIQPIAPFEIRGRVVRRTESGFAVDYELFDPKIRRLVDDVSAIVAAA